MHYSFIATAITVLLSLPTIPYASPQTPAQSVLSYNVAYDMETEVPAALPLPEILERIAVCESQGKHYDEDGNVLLGTINRHDVGKFQINALYWADEAEEMGINIYTEEGNEAFALELYNRYGTAPWKWSKKCWIS